MKKFKKLSALFLSVLLLLSCMTITAYAAQSAAQDGLSAVIETDKETYEANEPILVTVTVTNTNSFAMKNVSIESILPASLTVQDGTLKSDTIDLEAGEKLTLTFTAVLEKDVPPVTEPGTSEPDTSEPDTSEPDTTEPTVTDPSEPPTSEPDTSEPDTSEPDTSEPDTTEPGTSEPDTTEPVVTEPGTSEPDTTEPTVTDPSQTEPSETEPTVTEPTTQPITENPTAAGEVTTTEEQTTLTPETTTAVNAADHVNGTSPITGAPAVALKVLLVVAMVAAVAFAVVMLTRKNGKKATKIISVVLSVVICGSSLVTTGMIAKAEENTRSFSVDKTITVDGEDYTLSANAEYDIPQGTIKLYSDPKELNTSDTPQDVLFYINTENTTDDCEVTLVDADGDKKVADMHDDGKNGDKTANDGIYSTTVSVDCSEEKTLQYYAVIDDGSSSIMSKVREINIFAPMTDEEAENMETVDNRLADLTESSEYVNASDNDKVSYMKETLENMLDEGLITDYQFANDNLSVSYTYLDGITAYWNIVPESEDEQLNFDPDDVSNNLNQIFGTTARKLNTKASNNIAQQYYDEILLIHGWQYENEDNNYQVIANKLNANNHPTTRKYLPTVEEYKSLLTERNYKYIVIAEHGCRLVDSKGNYSSTSISTDEAVTSNRNFKYSSDLKDDRVIKVNNVYTLKPSFFAFYYQDELNGTIIDMESCMGVGEGKQENFDFSTAFLYDCGASTYIGYHNSVYILYAFYMTANMLGTMLSNNDNIGEAYVSAIAANGKNDVEYAYEHGPNHTYWEIPDPETGKTEKEEVDEKNKSGMAAYPVLLGHSKTTLNATMKFAGGNGSINNPYQIATAQQLDSVRYHLDSNFVLVDDIDLSEYENWEPIGGYIDVEAGDGLQGSFDGQGHTISNLKMDYTITPTGDSYPEYYFGLFSDTTLSPGIKNVNLENVNINISGTGDYIRNGGSSYIHVAGLSTNASVLTNINVNGKITTSLHCNYLDVGGVVNNANRVVNSTNQADISVNMTSLYPMADAYIGGVISKNGSILNGCSNYGNIYGEISEGSGLSRPRISIYCGGIASTSADAQITNCKNFGAIEGNTEEDAEVGGIVGASSADNITLCGNYGVVSARSYSCGDSMVGGIIGNAGSIARQGIIKQCVNFGKITSVCTLLPNELDSAYCGGITGNSWITDSVKLEECYNLANELEAVCRTSTEEKETNIGRISGVLLEYNGSTNISSCYSLDSTLMNGLPATEYVGPDQKNGGSMSRAEIEKAVTDLGFELPA